MALVERHREKGLVVLGLNDEPDPDRVAEFVRSKDVNYAVLPSMRGAFKTYGHRAYPTIVLVDREGIVRDRQTGFDEQRLQEAVVGLLEGKGVPGAGEGRR